MKTLVLGHNGMLGHMVIKYLLSKDIPVVTVNERWPFKHNNCSLFDFDGEYIINCIGAIPQKNTDFAVNYELPIWLDQNMDCKIINPGTDYGLDNNEYDSSKLKANDYILKRGKQTKTIRTAIIGPELKSKNGLFEWFMDSNGKVNGWTEAYWSGITTLQWAKECFSLMNNFYNSNLISTIATECITKYSLLNIIKEVFNKDIIINKNPDFKVNRCLISDIKVKNIKQQFIELKKFYYDN